MRKKIVIGILVFPLIFTFISVLNDRGKNNKTTITGNAKTANTQTDKQQQKYKTRKQAEISKYALEPYLPKDYPKTYEKLKDRWIEINNLRVKVAQIASKNKKCNYVALSELSTLNSTIDSLKFFADCKNGTRLKMSEEDIKNGSKILTEQERRWNKESAIKVCKKLIKNSVANPSTLEIYEITGTSIYETEITHNVVVRMDFDAKNRFNVKGEFKAICSFPPGKQGTIEIIEGRD